MSIGSLPVPSVPLQGYCYVTSQLSPDILGSFVLELGRYGSINTNPPISLAKDLADTIHEE